MPATIRIGSLVYEAVESDLYADENDTVPWEMRVVDRIPDYRPIQQILDDGTPLSAIHRTRGTNAVNVNYKRAEELDYHFPH